MIQSEPHVSAGACFGKGCLDFLRAGTLEQIYAYPWVPFSPGSVLIMKRTLVANHAVRRAFRSAGLRTVEVGILVKQFASTCAAYADRIAAGEDPVSANLDPLQFEAGLKALRAYAACRFHQERLSNSGEERMQRVPVRQISMEISDGRVQI